MKLCKNCKWFVLNGTWTSPELKSRYATCALTAFVDGSDGQECRGRRNRFFDACGKTGKQWEPK